MKNRLPLFMCCLCLLAGCSDSDSNENQNQIECDNSYITVCNEALTGYTVCRVGVITNIDCEVGLTCNPATNTCEPVQPSQCDENTVPVCNGKNARKICKNGALIDDPCPEKTECNEATATCDPVGEAPANECDENTAPVCNGKNARKICQSGKLTDESCPEKTECNESTATCEPVGEAPVSECDENTAPVCNGKNARKICQSGKLTDEPCPKNTECNESTATCEAVSTPPSGECDASSYTQTCPDPKHHTYCKDGQVVTEEYKSGAICNAELKEKKCKTPAEKDTCDPASFSESCYGDATALTCEDGKVTKVDCANAWGKGYKCDIVENYSDGKDAALCYSKKENCDTPGDSYTRCEFENEDGYDQHYTVTYVCVQGAVGNHYYAAEVVDCKHSCNKDETACSD